MKRSPHIFKEPDLQKIVILSTVLHLVFISILSVPLKREEPEFRSYFVNLVAAPEVQAPARETGTAPVKTDIKTKAAPPKEKSMVPEKGVSMEPEKSVSREIDRLRAISALSKKKKQDEEAQEAARKINEAITRAIEGIKKRQLISVSRGSGGPSAAPSSDAGSYFALITKKIWSEWIYPDLDTTGLEAIISIKIDRDGRVVSHRIEKSSGNDMFDRSAIKAVSKASPLPPPPVEMEIGVRFYI